MRERSLKHMTSDAQSLADQLGTQTTEALIRAVSGVQQTAHEGLAAAREGAASAGGQVGQVGQELAGGVQNLALPNTSVRMAWRAGRVVGRIEGAVRLAAFGMRVWWRRRRRRGGQGQRSTAWVRVVAQWGPAVVATGYLATQLWMRLRRGSVSS